MWTTTLDAVHKNRVHGVSEFGPPHLSDLTLLPFWLIATALLVLTIGVKPWRQASIARRFVVVAAVALLPHDTAYDDLTRFDYGRLFIGVSVLSPHETLKTGV